MSPRALTLHHPARNKSNFPLVFRGDVFRLGSLGTLGDPECHALAISQGAAPVAADVISMSRSSCPSRESITASWLDTSSSNSAVERFSVTSFELLTTVRLQLRPYMSDLISQSVDLFACIVVARYQFVGMAHP